MLKPYMPQYEIAIFDMLLHLLKPERVLEYGAGGSTVRWSMFPSVQRWVTVEHDLEWARRVCAYCHVYHTRAEMLRVDEEPAETYVMAPGGGPLFDLIFVDGIHRVECVRASHQFLAPGGVVVLHDVRQNDHAGCWDEYPHKVILGQGDALHNGFLVMWE